MAPFLMTLVLFNSITPTFGSEEEAMTKPQVETVLSSGKLTLVKSKSEVPKIWWKAMAVNEMA